MTAAQNPLTPEPVVLDPGFSTDLATPARALAIGAHPDDIDFTCGGTLAKWAASGCEVSVLVCTDGSKGTWDPDIDQAGLIATRRREQRAAVEALGGTGEVYFLAWSDGELESGLRERAQVAQIIRMVRPDVVLGHDPWKPYRLHPDHRHAGLLAVEGLVAARDPLFFPEQPVPHHRPDHLLLFEAGAPDHAEDVHGFAEAKIAALRCHRSQFESTMHTDADDSSEFGRAIVAKLAVAGQAAGFAQAEVFKLIDDL